MPNGAKCLIDVKEVKVEFGNETGAVARVIRVPVIDGTTDVHVTIKVTILRFQKLDPISEEMVVTAASLKEIVFGARMVKLFPETNEVEIEVFGNLESGDPKITWTGVITVEVWCFANVTQATP